MIQEKTKKLKKRYDNIAMELQASFNVMKRYCDYKEMSYEADGAYYNCNCPEYHLAEYIKIRPCRYNKCPLLKD